MTSQGNFTLDDLPRFSPWPSRLLGLQSWEQKQKTPQEISREYENEKWGALLEQVKTTDRLVTIKEVETEMFAHTTETICNIGDDLLLLSAAEMHQRYLDFISASLASYLPATALVELAAGYGSIQLGLVSRDMFSKMPLIAGDFTPSGVELIRRFSTAQGLEVQAALCDFNAQPITTLSIPSGAIIYTVYGLSCVPFLSVETIRAIASYSPKMVINFEPCLEHCDSNSLLGLMRKRYIEINGYNTNLVTLLHEEQDIGNIRIIEERPCAFGKNPFFSASVIAWEPQ